MTSKFIAVGSSHNTQTTESSPAQTGLNLPVQARVVPGFKVEVGESADTVAAASVSIPDLMVPESSKDGLPNGIFSHYGPPYATSDGIMQSPHDPVGSRMELELDSWTAPVSVCHACGNSIR
jgi:hypothetical protein